MDRLITVKEMAAIQKLPIILMFAPQLKSPINSGRMKMAAEDLNYCGEHSKEQWKFNTGHLLKVRV